MSSFLILLGGLLAIVVLWVLSVLAVRWDTRRRGTTDLEQRAWLAITVLLPLFGFALYLFMRVLRRYLTPQPMTGPDPRLAQARARVEAYHVSPAERAGGVQAKQPLPQIANMAKPGSVFPQTAVAPKQPHRASYALEAAEGPHLGQQFILAQFPAQIGRGPEMAIPLDADLNVSRRHAEVYEWNGALRVRDLRSSHGTLVNGKPVSDQPLFPGDKIGLGTSVLVLRDTANPMD